MDSSTRGRKTGRRVGRKPPARFRCSNSECDLEFQLERQKYEHEKLAHPNDVAISEHYKCRTGACSGAQALFASKPELEDHYKTSPNHQSRYMHVCPHCGRQKPGAYEAYLHVSFHHEETLCEICLTRFAGATFLQRHWEQMHRPLHSGICPRSPLCEPGHCKADGCDVRGLAVVKLQQHVRARHWDRPLVFDVVPGPVPPSAPTPAASSLATASPGRSTSTGDPSAALMSSRKRDRRSAPGMESGLERGGVQKRGRVRGSTFHQSSGATRSKPALIVPVGSGWRSPSPSEVSMTVDVKPVPPQLNEEGALRAGDAHSLLPAPSSRWMD